MQVGRYVIARRNIKDKRISPGDFGRVVSHYEARNVLLVQWLVCKIPTFGGGNGEVGSEFLRAARSHEIQKHVEALPKSGDLIYKDVGGGALYHLWVNRCDDDRIEVMVVERAGRVESSNSLHWVSAYGGKVLQRGVVLRRTESERSNIQQKYRNNLNGQNTAYMPRDFRASSIRYRKVLGHSLALAVNNNEIDDNLIEATNRLGIARRVMDILDEKATRVANEVYVCGNCGYLAEYDDTSYSEDSDIRFCGGCTENFEWSDLMDTYVHISNTVRYYESAYDYHNGNFEIVTSGYAGSRLGALEYDGDYFDETAHYDLGFGDGSGDSYVAGLTSYHSGDRVFSEQGATPAFPALGVELEVYSKRRRESVSALRSHYDNQDLILETDGSLHDDYGFEVVTQPYGKEKWKEHAPRILDALVGSGAVGYNHPDRGNRYGIHISVARKILSPLQEARMLMFLLADENVEFVQAIAQRKNIYNASYDLGAVSKAHQRIGLVAGGLDEKYENGKHRKKILGHAKYMPINVKSKILEFRIFQSTLLETSFFKNLEFVWALIEWTRPSSASGSSWMFTGFVRWLSVRPKAEQDYPNLVAYLRKPKYITKFSDGPIHNTWVDLLRAPVRSSISIETDEDISVTT